jgi:hypothetical protein
MWDEFLKNEFPKWSSLCLLRYLGFRTLDAVLINHDVSRADITFNLHEFTTQLSLNKVLIRTDGGKERGGYPRGGNSLDQQQAFDFISNMQELKRAVILMQPTNRFTNSLSLNLLMDYSGAFVVEALGPGFDISDLNRGLMRPQVSISTAMVDWETFDPPRPYLTKHVSTPIAELRQQRLSRIGQELLPAIGISSDGSPEVLAEEWLRSNGFVGLFEGMMPPIGFSTFRKWYEDGFMIGMFYRRKTRWNALVVSASDLGDGKGLCFWDVSNPQEKFLVD